MNEITNVFEDVKFQDGGWVLWVPIFLMGCDVLAGVIHAWATGHLKSYRMREGLGRKCFEIIVLLIGWILTVGMNVPSAILIGISLYITGMELVSILENWKKMGLPVPKRIDKAFEYINDKIQNGSDADKKEGEESAKTGDDKQG